MKKALLSFIALALLAFAGAVIHSSGRGEPPELPAATPEDRSAVIEKVRYFGYSGEDDGRREWELEADSAELFRGEDLTVFKGVKVVFFSKDGDLYTLRSMGGTYSESAGVIALTGGVTLISSGDEGGVAVGPDGSYSFRAKSVEYSTRSREVTSRGKVEIESDNFIVTGVGFEMDVEKSAFSILSDVKTVLKDGFADGFTGGFNDM